MKGGVLLKLLGVATTLPVFALGGGIAAIPFAYGSESEDADHPSSLVTVMAVWERDGQSLCRAFMYRDLLTHLDTLRLRFTLTPQDIQRCRADFAAYDSHEGWPIKLREDELRYPAYSFELEDTTPELAITVHRSSGDANWAETRYRVDTNGEVFDLETNTASAGQGIGLVMGAFVGMLAWLAWVVWLALAAWRRRRMAH